MLFGAVCVCPLLDGCGGWASGVADVIRLAAFCWFVWVGSVTVVEWRRASGTGARRWGVALVRVASVVALLALAAGVYDQAVRQFCDGTATDLEVVFVVVDGVTGEPIEGAAVAVTSGGGWYAEEDRQRDADGFTLLTDAGGSAHRVCRKNWVNVNRSGLGFTTRRQAYMPFWMASASAPGYCSSEPISVSSRSRSNAVKLVAIKTHRAEVRIPLFRE